MSLSTLTHIIFNMDLTHLGLSASIIYIKFISASVIMIQEIDQYLVPISGTYFSLWIKTYILFYFKFLVKIRFFCFFKYTVNIQVFLL